MTKIETFSINYNSSIEAEEKYKMLPEGVKNSMAVDYREAFGGYPWYEKFKCTGTAKCDFLAEAFCPICKSDNNISEAYPIEWLKEEYFPEMLGKFIPGILALAQIGGEIPGFTTGGFSSLESLIIRKYTKNTEAVLNSIKKQFSISSSNFLFYDNETCILPEQQSSGIGSTLNQFRIEEAMRLGADLVCGRTINFKWLKIKEEQFTQNDYSFKYFIPDGDNYSVNGNPRYFYLAKMLK